MRNASRFALVLSSALVAACTTDDSGPPAADEPDSAVAGDDATVDLGSDAGTDASADATVDSSVDTGSDAGLVDTGVDSPTDASFDAPNDSALDAPTDTGTDAPVDAGTDAPADAGNPIIAIATGLTFPDQLIVSGGYAFWIDGNAIQQCAVTGCGSTPLTLTVDTDVPNNLSADAQNVYFTTNTTVKVVPIGSDGGAATLLSNEPDNPFAITGGAAGVYWSSGYMGDSNFNGAVVTCDPANCVATRTVMATSQVGVNSMQLTPTDVIWGGRGNPGSQSFVRTCPQGGCDGGPTTLLYPDQNLTSLQIDTSRFYFVDFSLANNSFHPRSCPLAGCPADGGLLLSTTASEGSELAVDGTNVYWFTYGNVLVSCPMTGCAGAAHAITTLTGSTNVATFAVDATNVYFTSPGDGSVYRVAK